LHDRTQEVESYLNKVLEKAEEKIRYISSNTNIQDSNSILFEKDYLNEISIAIIDENKNIIDSSSNFDKETLNKFLDKTSRKMHKLRNNNILWYYGGTIDDKIIATAKDLRNKTKVIFIIDLTKALNTISYLQPNPGEYFRQFNVAIIDSNQNLAVTSNKNWFEKFNANILNRFFAKGYERKARIFQLSGRNYLLQNIGYIPFTIITSVDQDEVFQNTIKILFVRTIEIVGGIIAFLLLILLIFRERVLKQRLIKSKAIAQKATEAKTDFLNFVAHEIKSPLSCISTTSQILQNRILGESIEPYDYYIDSIANNCMLISEFIDDLLMEELVLRGKFKIELAAHNIFDIVNRSIEINNIRYADRNITLVNNVSELLPKIICDYKRMVQIFNNLISNSIKFSKDQSKVEIYSNIQDNIVMISVKDQGLGLSSKQIYDLQNQKNNINVTDQDLESHGIGFNIVKILATAQNIELVIESKINCGTTINLIFKSEAIVF
jgi:signal transduction histidine kinase